MFSFLCLYEELYWVTLSMGVFSVLSIIVLIFIIVKHLVYYDRTILCCLFIKNEWMKHPNNHLNWLLFPRSFFKARSNNNHLRLLGLPLLKQISEISHTVYVLLHFSDPILLISYLYFKETTCTKFLISRTSSLRSLLQYPSLLMFILLCGKGLEQILTDKWKLITFPVQEKVVEEVRPLRYFSQKLYQTWIKGITLVM